MLISKDHVSRFSLRQMTGIALMSAVTAVSAWITIPAPVPFTLQTFSVFLALLALGGRDGTLSILFYILLGLVGLPVFSSFRSGPGVLLGPTGGYILGFLVLGLFYWVLARKAGRLWIRILLLGSGLLLCYAFGTAWYVHVTSGNGNPVSFGGALLTCVVPFLLPDLLKLALAVVISQRLRSAR